MNHALLLLVPLRDLLSYIDLLIVAPWFLKIYLFYQAKTTRQVLILKAMIKYIVLPRL